MNIIKSRAYHFFWPYKLNTNNERKVKLKITELNYKGISRVR